MSRWLGPALPAWLATRLGMAAMSVFAASFSANMLHRQTSPLRIWLEWDTGWYLTISQAGYATADSANFFPLFPALVGLATRALGHGQRPADDSFRLGVALLLCSLFALAAMAAVGRLVEDARPGLQQRALLALAAFPTAFFLTAAYTEAPFIALATLSLVLARRRRWAPAAACAVLAGLTRSTALILVLPLFWEAVREGRDRRRLATAAALGAAPLLGIALYSAYLGYRFGDPLLFVHTQAGQWHHQLQAPWQTARLVAEHLVHRRAGMLPFDLSIWTAALIATVAGARRLPISYTLLAAGVLVTAVAAPVTVQNDVMASAGRYVLAATPIFAVVAGWMRASRTFELAYVVCGLLLQAGLLLTFLLGGPVL